MQSRWSCRIAIAFILFCFGSILCAAPPAPTAGGVVDTLTNSVSWAENSILALIFTVILGAFKAADYFIMRRGRGTDTQVFEIKLKLEQAINEIQNLAINPTGQFIQFKNDIIHDLEDIHGALGRHDAASARSREFIQSLYDKVNHIFEILNQLSVLTARADSDGVPLIYVPRGWHETQRDIESALKKVADNQQRMLEILVKLER